MKLLMAFLFLGLGCCPVEVFGLPPAKILYVTGNPDADSSPATVWSMDSSGAIRLLKNFSGKGDRSPLPSPDGLKIAYLRNDNIWIWDIPHNRSWQVTKEGSPVGKDYWWVSIEITSWSPDSRQLLYHLMRGYYDDYNEGEAPTKTKPLPYGYRFYSLTTHKSKSVSRERYIGEKFETSIEGEFLGWNQTGEILLQTPGSPANTLKAMDRGGKIRTIYEGSKIDDLKFSYSPIFNGKDGPKFWFFSRDGSKTLATSEKFMEWKRLIEINLISGEAREVSQKDNYDTRYMEPSYSPDGNHIAWMNGKMAQNHPLSEKLLVDKKVVFQCQENFVYQWIDDQCVALETDKELMILSISDGKILGRYSLVQENNTVLK